MTKLLHVAGSPRRERSASREVAGAFLAAYREAHPADEIDTIDVWSLDLPAFDGAALEAKYAGIAGLERTAEQKAMWARIAEFARPLIEADKLVFSVPMWNFGIPYRLKHWFDVVSQKDLVFAFDAQGLRGLLGGKRVLLVCARGVGFGQDSQTPAAGWDQQTAWLDVWLRMVGIDDVRSVLIEKTLYGPDADRAARDVALAQAVALARDF